MDHTAAEDQQQVQQQSAADRTVYVDELTDENDYWMSLTDAARVCRVQDVSIRRAITAGRLPVRRRPGGNNRRTRFVRASDLPLAGYPILDSGAAITSEIRKVDVLNIPLQQQQLAEEQQRVRTLLDAQVQEMADLRAEERRQEALLLVLQEAQAQAQERLEQIQTHLGAMQNEIHLQATRLEEQRANLTTQMTRLDQRVGQQHEEYQASLAHQQSQMTSLYQHVEQQHHDYLQTFQDHRGQMRELVETEARLRREEIGKEQQERQEAIQEVKRLENKARKAQGQQWEQALSLALQDLRHTLTAGITADFEGRLHTMREEIEATQVKHITHLSSALTQIQQEMQTAQQHIKWVDAVLNHHKSAQAQIAERVQSCEGMLKTLKSDRGEKR